MATTVTSHIGPGRDYNTPQLWADALPSSLVTADQVWVGHLYPEGAGTNGEWTGTTNVVTIPAVTTDATRYIEFRAAVGHSFRDHPSAATNPLRYDPSKGVALRTTSGYSDVFLASNVNYVRLFGLQMAAPGGGFGRVLYMGNTSGCRVDSCILTGQIITYLNGNYGHVWVNNLMVLNAVGGGGSIFNNAYTDINTRIEYCTMIAANGGGLVVNATYTPVTFENCAYFNFATGTTVSSGGSILGSHNATDLPTSPLSDTLLSLVFADQFENVTNDYRAKLGGNLAAGVHNASFTVDILGVARSGSVPTIGCWELPSGLVLTRTASEGLTAMDAVTGLLDPPPPDSGFSRTFVWGPV